MSRAEEVSTEPEREREPAAACTGGPSEDSETKGKVSRSSRAGLLFPVSRIDRLLRRGRFAKRIGAAAPIYLAAALQCVTQHTVEVAGNISKESKKQRISPRHLQLAVQSSPELKQLLRGMPGHQGSAVPHSQLVASPRNKKRKSEKRWLGQKVAAAPAPAPASSK
ncbi:histone H2A-beta, sperm-like [Rhea pennata]|uniref:histone H2A-beta, sperm-like n=1 Tax=Rhea pennata TaxID=8795 RepID=UPI002E26E7EB